MHPYIATNDPTYTPGMSDHERELQGIRNGSLYPYTNATDVYNCPGDKTWKTTTNYGVGSSPFRSFATNLSMNGQWNTSRIYTKISQIKFPSEKFILIEEEELGGANWGTWILPTNPSTPTWWDTIAIWHSKASTDLNFADGHAERRVWGDESTVYMFEEKQQGVRPSDWGEWFDLDYIRRAYHDDYRASTQP